jgi:MFS family permease
MPVTTAPGPAPSVYSTDSRKSSSSNGRPLLDDDPTLPQRDFGFVPIPTYLKHVEGSEISFGIWLNLAFGAFATFSAYPPYPLHSSSEILTKIRISCRESVLLPTHPRQLGRKLRCRRACRLQVSLSQSLPILIPLTEHGTISIPTVIQAGYATGLLFLTPLGDLIPRRPLLLLLTLLSASFTLGLAATPSLRVFTALNFLVGTTSVVPQVLVPLVADLAPPARKAGAIGLIWSAVMLGILFARLLAGLIAGLSHYRNVYWMAAALQFGTLLTAWATVPNVPRKNEGCGLGYFGILGSMAKVAVTEPLLIQASVGGILNNMWVDIDYSWRGRY